MSSALISSAIASHISKSSSYQTLLGIEKNLADDYILGGLFEGGHLNSYEVLRGLIWLFFNDH